MNRSGIALCLVSIAFCFPTHGAQFEIDGSFLTVNSDNYRVVLHGGAIVHIENRLTSDPHPIPFPEGEGAVQDRKPGEAGYPGLDHLNEPVICHGTGVFTWDNEEGIAIYRERVGDALLVMTVSVDLETGDLVLKQEGTGAPPGVRGIHWGIRGLSLEEAELIVPAGGGVLIDRENPRERIEFTYPYHWESQMAIYQTENGGFCFWSTDTTYQFKELRYHRYGDRFDLTVMTENPAPFTEKTSADSVEWRFNVYKGDWRVPARRYRDWMEEGLGLTRWEEELPWARDIRAMVIAHGDRIHPSYLERLAEQLIPERTLLYIPNWRSHCYDCLYPDYEPSNWIEPFTRQAQAMGFRVMLHVNLPGIGWDHPLYDEFKDYQVLHKIGLNPMGWYWERKLPVTHAFINPAYRPYRELFLEKMKGVVEAVRPDLLHLDVSAPIWNDGRGLIDGMTYGAGNRLLHEELKAALPEIVLGGESICEPTLFGERFYQVWTVRIPGRPHPIRTFLFEPFAIGVGYLGFPNPDQSLLEYREYAGDYEWWGVLPTLSLTMQIPAWMEEPRTLALLRMARHWQETLLEPAFDRDWADDQRFVWRGGDDIHAEIRELSEGSVRMSIGNTLHYERIRNATEWQTPLCIPGWPAWDGDRALALDPSSEYEAIPAKRLEPAIRLTGITPGAILSEFRADEHAGVLVFSRASDPVIRDLASGHFTARTGVIIEGEEGPLQRRATFGTWSGTERHQNPILASVCPWETEDERQDYAWGNVFLEYAPITIEPERSRKGPLLFVFDSAIGQSALKGDGSEFIVEIGLADGTREELFRVWRKDTEWKTHRIALPVRAGEPFTLRLVMDPGPNDSVSYDLGLWRNPRILAEVHPETSHLLAKIESGYSDPKALGAVIESSLEGTVTLRASIAEPIVIFGREPFPIETDTHLLEVPFVHGITDGTIYSPGVTAWGSGSMGMHEKEDGSRVRTISGHPPSRGETVIRQIVQPAESMASPRLLFSARVREGSTTTGVGFRVVLNGRRVWKWDTSEPGEKNGEISLETYQGKPLLIEWITDSLGKGDYDWATWDDPRIVEGR